MVGRCCESGGILIEDLAVPSDVQPGDILAVFNTGAYNYSMASNYNMLPKPAVVFVDKGKTYYGREKHTMICWPNKSSSLMFRKLLHKTRVACFIGKLIVGHAL